MSSPVGALLIIDAQQGVLDGAAAVPQAGAVLSRLGALLAAARSAGALVVHGQHDGAPGTLDEPGTAGWLIHPSVAPAPGEGLLRKTQDDAFDGTPLEALLARRRITRLAVAGLLSEMCVSATVRGALARGLGVVLVRDAHATYDLDDIPAAVVARVAEHALGDEVELVDAAAVTFSRPAGAPAA
jgi:nicotinamidase-related amidase